MTSNSCTPAAVGTNRALAVRMLPVGAVALDPQDPEVVAPTWRSCGDEVREFEADSWSDWGYLEINPTVPVEPTRWGTLRSRFGP